MLQGAGSQSIERIEPQILPQPLLQLRQRPTRDALEDVLLVSTLSSMEAARAGGAVA
jgi:hypothetical protein